MQLILQISKGDAMKRCTFKKIYFQLAFLTLTAFSYPGAVTANPVNPLVMAGKAKFEHPNASTLVVNTPSDRLVINWEGFSIDKGELTKFVQPGKDSAVLNRVTGGSRSEIFGAIDANGQVYLINPNGIIMGRDSQINASAFLASTLDVSDANFLDGGDLNFLGKDVGTVVNFGTINAFEGDVILLGFQVDNQGNIIAPNGTAGIGAGQEILLQVGKDKKFLIHPKQTSKSDGTGVNVGGTIQALRAEIQADGAAYNLAINHTGIVEATGVVNRGGQVYLSAEGGDTFVNGRIRADESVHVLGKRVGLYDKADINTSNKNNGGNVYIGGGYQGSDENIYNANQTYVAGGAKINSSAIESGNAGNVVVWADQTTQYYGDIQARGGSESGNGGFVEISGKGYLDFNGKADRSAENGNLGTLLLDPRSITITNTDNNIQTYSVDPFHTEYTPDGLLSSIDTATINLALQSGDVIVATDNDGSPGAGNIYWEEGNDLVVTPPTDTSLILNSINNIYMGSAYANTGNGDVVFKAVNDINFQNLNGTGTVVGILIGGGSITLQAQNVNLLQSAIPLQIGNQGHPNTGNVLVDATNGNFRMEGGFIAGQPADLSSSAGNVHVNVFNGDLFLSGVASPATISAQKVHVNVRDGSLYLQGSTFDETTDAGAAIVANTGVNVEAGRDLNLRSGDGVSNFSGIFNVSGDMNFDIGGDVNLFGGNADQTFAQVGSLNSTSTTNISFTHIGGNLNLIGSQNATATNSFAAIGSGDITSIVAGSWSGNINITGSEGTTITLLDGAAPNSFAQIGHFGNQVTSNTISGDIAVNGVGQGILLTPQANYAVIGHGSNFSKLSITGNIDVDISGGDLDLRATSISGVNTVALIGHLDGNNITGDVNVNLNGGELKLISGDSANAIAGIGFFDDIDSTIYNGKVSVDAKTIDVIAGNAAGADAFIGFRHGINILPTSSVTVSADSDILVQAGVTAAPTGGGGNAFIGYQSTVATPIYLDSINVTSREGNISIYGGPSTDLVSGFGFIGVELLGVTGAQQPQSPVTILAKNGTLGLFGKQQTIAGSGGAAIINTNAITEPFDLVIDVGTLRLIGGSTAPVAGGATALINSPFNTNITTKENLELYSQNGTATINTGLGQSTFDVGKDLILQAGIGIAQIGSPIPTGNNADLTFKNVGGDVVVRGGTATQATAIIGHGRRANTATGAYAGNIVFDHIGGNVTIQGGTNSFATAQIGHIGSSVVLPTSVTNNLLGDVILKDIDGSLQIRGGSGNSATATLGHADQSTNFGNIRGYIEANASSVYLIAGQAPNTSRADATIGFNPAPGSGGVINSQGITVHSNDGISLTAGVDSLATIGYTAFGGASQSEIQSIDVLAETGNVTLTAGVGLLADAFIGTRSTAPDIFAPRSNIRVKAGQDVVLTIPTTPAGNGASAIIANTNINNGIPFDVTIDASAIVLLTGQAAAPIGEAYIYSGSNLDLTFSDRLDINFDATQPNSLQAGSAFTSAHESAFINTHKPSLGAINVLGPSPGTEFSGISAAEGDVIIGSDNFLGAGAVTIGSLSATQLGASQIVGTNIDANIEGPLVVAAQAATVLSRIFANNNSDIKAQENIQINNCESLGEAYIATSVGNNSVHTEQDISINQNGSIFIDGFNSNGKLDVTASRNVTLDCGGIIANNGLGDVNVSAGHDVTVNDGSLITTIGTGNVNIDAARDFNVTTASIVSGGGINTTAGRDTLVFSSAIRQTLANDAGIHMESGRDVIVTAVSPGISEISQVGTGDTIIHAGQDIDGTNAVILTAGEITTIAAERDQNWNASIITQTAPEGVFTASAGQDITLDDITVVTTDAATANVTAGQDIFVLGGSIINHTGVSTFNIDAGEDLQVITTEEGPTSTILSTATVANITTGQDVIVTGSIIDHTGAGQFNLDSGNDVTLTDGIIATTAADTHVHAEKDINLFDDSDLIQTGTSIFDLKAGEDVNVTASTILTNAQDANFVAGQDINFNSATIEQNGDSKLKLDAGEDINIANSTVLSNAKDIKVNAGDDIHITDSIISQTGGDALTFTSGQGILIDGVTQILSPAEDVSFTAGLDIKFEDNAVVEHTGTGFFTVDARENFFMNQNARITTNALKGTFNAGINMFMTGNTMINFNSSGIQTYNIGLDLTMKNNALISTSDATTYINVGRDIFLDGNAKILAFGNREFRMEAGNDIIMDDDALIHQQDGEMFIIAGHSMIMKERNLIENEFGNITIVVDNDYPTPPFFGTGGFRMSNGSKINTNNHGDFHHYHHHHVSNHHDSHHNCSHHDCDNEVSTFDHRSSHHHHGDDHRHGTVRIFTSRRAFNRISGRINGFKFTPGIEFINTPEEQWHTYFNTAIKGVPFTVFYKNSGKPHFPQPPLTGRILHDFRLATSEAFVDWRYYDRFYFDVRCIDLFSTCAYTGPCEDREYDLLAQYKMLRQLYHNRHTVQYDLISALPF